MTLALLSVNAPILSKLVNASPYYLNKTMTPNQLKTLRGLAKATQAECAAMISVPTRRFQRWEAGKPCIPYSDFNLLCIFLRTKNRITLDQARALMCPIAFDTNFLSET